MLRVFILLILLLYTAAAKQEVFFSVDNTSYIWKEIQVKQLQKEFLAYEDIAFSYANGEGNIAKQVSDLEKAIAKKVDAIIVSPIDTQLIAKVVDKAYDQGIKVIFAIRRANTHKYHSYIHPDDRLIAQAAAKYVLLKRSDAKIVMIQGRVGANTVRNRKKGFLEVIEQSYDAKVVAIEVGNYKPDEALKVMDKIIKKGIEFNVVYTHNDAMQEGVRIALKEHGFDLSKILLVGIDYIKDAKEAIKRQEMDATFTYPTSAKQIASTTVKLLNGKKAKKDIIVPSTLITKENIEKVEPLF